MYVVKSLDFIVFIVFHQPRPQVLSPNRWRVGENSGNEVGLEHLLVDPEVYIVG